MEISSGGQTNRSLAASGTTAIRRTGTKFLTAIARKRHVSSPLTHDKLSVLGPSQVHPDSQTRLSIGHIQQRDRSHSALSWAPGILLEYRPSGSRKGCFCLRVESPVYCIAHSPSSAQGWSEPECPPAPSPVACPPRPPTPPQVTHRNAERTLAPHVPLAKLASSRYMIPDFPSGCLGFEVMR